MTIKTFALEKDFRLYWSKCQETLKMAENMVNNQNERKKLKLIIIECVKTVNCLLQEIKNQLQNKIYEPLTFRIES